MKNFSLFLSFLILVCVSCKKDTNPSTAARPGLPGGAPGVQTGVPSAPPPPAPGPCAGVNTPAYLQAYQQLLNNSFKDPVTKKAIHYTRHTKPFLCRKLERNPIHFELITYDYEDGAAAAQSPRMMCSFLIDGQVVSYANTKDSPVCALADSASKTSCNLPGLIATYQNQGYKCFHMQYGDL